jgi:putative transposase
MIKASSSNLTQAQFELIEPLIPQALPGGRPREVEISAGLCCKKFEKRYF